MRSRSSKPSLYAFLQVLAVVVAITGFAVYGTSVFAFARMTEAQVRAESARDTALAVEAVKAVLEEPAGRIRSMAAAIGTSGSSILRSPSLDKVVQSAPMVNSIRILDTAGVVLSTVPYDASLIGVDFSRAPVIAAAMSRPGIHWSSLYAGIAEGEREISVALREQGFIVFAVLNFTALAQRIGALIERSGSSLSIADASGVYIAHSDRSRVQRRDASAELLRARIEEPGKDAYQYERIRDGARSFARAELIRETGWFVIYERSTDYAMEAVNSSALSVFIVTILVIGAASGFVLFARGKLLSDVAAAAKGDVRMFFQETAAISDSLRMKDEDNERLSALNRRLSDTLDELSRTQESLVVSEKLALLGRLAATVAHDLNTPLGASSSAAAAIHDAARKLLSDAETAAIICGEAEPELFQAILRATTEFDPSVMAAGSHRRTTIRLAEKTLAATGSPSAGVLADRLVDIGMRDEADLRLIARAAENEKTARVLERALSIAEIIVAARIILRSAGNAAAVVSSLRTYVKSGEETPPEPLNLAMSIGEALSLIRRKAGRGIQILTDMPENQFVVGKKEQLARVWLNLFMNAIEAIGQHGRLDVRVETRDTQVIVHVEDDGPGIPPDIADSIWKPFFTTKGAGQGTGLGLSIVKETVERMGGTVSMESNPGRTVFSIALPTVSGEAPDG